MKGLRAAAVGALLAAAAPATAQPVTERSPNMEGTWITAPRNLHFQFAHRFEVVGQDADIGDIFTDGKIVNYPTFALGYGLFRGAMIGFRYSTNSLVARQANEWQPFVKFSPLFRSGTSKASVSFTGAWNGATQSADGEIAFQGDAGRLILLGAVRGFTSVFDLPAGTDDEALALAGGLGIRLNRYLTLAGDVADLVAGPDGTAAWSAGLQIGIPHTPHTLSIMATNVSSGTLEGTSAGIPGAVYYGFEFTVPFSGFARWGRIFSPEDVSAPPDGRRQAPPTHVDPRAAVVEIGISRFGFERPEIAIPPGTTVRWVNRDPVAHTSTSDALDWDSPLIGPGETWEMTFDEPGRYAYHCRPHPFMKAVVVVREP